METINISCGKENNTNDTFYATLRFPDESVYENIPIKDPFNETNTATNNATNTATNSEFNEQNLQWYFEKHLQFPFINTTKANRITGLISQYGENLFNQLLKDETARQKWRNLTNSLSPLHLKITSQNKTFQSLHWETFKDPNEPKPFALTHPITRNSGTPSPEKEIEKHHHLNILMVTARPWGKTDLAYRTITRPVVEAVEKNRTNTRIHLLRPPTLKALTDHLKTRRGHYHIIHFDVHGGLLTYHQYQKITPNKAAGSPHRLNPYDGTQPFIFLHAQVGAQQEAEPVHADTLAAILNEARIPVCFLNACRSAMPVLSPKENTKEENDKWEAGTSLAMTFLDKGVKMVLGMAWNLTETGARIMMTELYDALAREEEPRTALQMARRAMADDDVRFKCPERETVLADWLLPVVWAKGDVNLALQLRKPGFEEKEAEAQRKVKRKEELKEMTVTGTYGFMGRDLEILEVEQALLADNMLLLKGMGGTGKTTLLGHMAHWWLQTDWIDAVTYFSYDQKPHGADAVLNAVAEAAMPREELGHFLVMPDVDTRAQVLCDFLKPGKDTPRVLLVLDNLESAAGVDAAVGSRMEERDREILARVIACLLDSGIKVLLGSRSPVDWLCRGAGTVYSLTGLDNEAAAQLAERILDKTGVTGARGKSRDWKGGQWEEYSRLLDILAGYPLAMEIILPNLLHRTAGEMRGMLAGEGVTLAGADVSEEIFKCVNVSFALLDEKARKSVLVFAPFTSFFNGMGIEVYLKLLQEDGAFGELVLDDIRAALAQAERQGLVKEILTGGYSLQPVFPFFLSTQAEAVFSTEEKAALDRAFCGYMEMLAVLYKQLMQGKEAAEKQVGTALFKMDRENLSGALNRVLDREGDFYGLYIVFSTYYFEKPLHTEAIGFMEGLVKRLDGYSQKDNDFLARFAVVVGNLGSEYMEVKNYANARSGFEKALSLLQAAGKRQESATAYHQLGMVAEEQRDWEEAKSNYTEALTIFQEFNDRHTQARTYHQLGIVAQAQRDWEEAKSNYTEALKIDQEFNDRYSQASTYHQLGMVAEEQRDWEEAKSNYTRALKIKQEFNDRYSQASTYHQLGRVAQEQRDWAEAKSNYTEALKIFQEFNDRYSQASTYHQLGAVAQEEHDWDEAKRHCSEALNIYREFNDLHGQARLYHQLGSLAHEENDYPTALADYAVALVILNEYNDGHNLGIVTGNIVRLFSAWSGAEARRAIREIDQDEDTKSALIKILESTEKENESPTDQQE